jgi:hypothetical protein
MAPPITRLQGRVGRHTKDHGRQAQNWAADQRVVIDLLNRIPFAEGGAEGRLGTHIVSGISSDELYRAISAFEDKQFRGQRRGYVDPGGTMLKRMEALAAAATQIAPAGTAPVLRHRYQKQEPEPSLIYSAIFKKSGNERSYLDEDTGIHLLPPKKYSLPILSRLSQFGGQGGNALTAFEKQLIDDFKNNKISQIITERYMDTLSQM